ncbi:MAG TPA: 50S ribosomal protein L21 [Chloroflexota bacterium]|jgi:large subunit ribosomal protein L21
MFAVVQTGGKQYRVAVGQSIQVEKLPQVKGDSIEFERVLMVGEGDQITAGTPLVAGARVVATISRQERGPKILVFRYKSKKRVRVLRGHRQNLTQLFIRDIVINGESTAAHLAPAKQPAPAVATVSAEQTAEPEVAAVAPLPESGAEMAAPAADAAPVVEAAPAKGTAAVESPVAEPAAAPGETPLTPETPTATTEGTEA